MRAREKREAHLLVVDEGVVHPPGAGHPPHVLRPEKHAEVVRALFPSGIDHEVLRIDAPRMRHRMLRHPRVDGVALHVRVESRLSESQPNSVAEALPGNPHSDAAWQGAPLERAAVLQDEIGLAGVRVRARVAAFGHSGPGFEITASGTGVLTSRPAEPVEYVLDALPMGGECGGSLVLGIQRDMADLIACLDRAFAEEAWPATLGMAGAERSGVFKVPSSAG